MRGLPLLPKSEVIFEDVWQSVFHSDEIDSDIQVFVDSYPELSHPQEFPQCPFIIPFQNYCSLENFQHPKITQILSQDLNRAPKTLASEIAYEPFLLAISITFSFLPAFGGTLPQTAEEVSSPESKKDSDPNTSGSLSKVSKPIHREDQRFFRGEEYSF